MAIPRPPGPRDGLYGVRLVGRIKADILGSYTDFHHRFGDVVYMRLGPYHDYTFFHPEQIQEVLVAQARHFIRMPGPLKVLRQWNGDGLLIPEGETWLRLRRLVQPAFNTRRFAGYAEVAVTATAKRFDSWPRQPGSVIEFEQAMTGLTMDIIARTMFGADLKDETAELSRAVRILSEVAVREMMSPFTWPDWLPLPGKAAKRWAMRTIDALVRRFIRERRQDSTDRGDLLSILLLAADEEGDGRRLTDEQARDQCVTIFLGGHDTTAAGLIWAGWALASHPEVASRAAAEVDAVLAGRPPTYADLPRLGYTERVVKEALRHYPPAVGVFARQALQDLEIGDWTVPKGGIVRILSYVTHHDPRWFSEPERFDPDRFAPGQVEQIPPCAYLPFGAGPRVCIGNSFAMMEMTLVTALLLQRFTLAPAPDQGPPKLDPKMSLRPVGGMRLALTPRQSLPAKAE
jgi:cytochrome P450